MKIDRSKYYSADKYGNMLFNVTRCFNDLQMAKKLITTIEKGTYDTDNIKISYTLYISKLYFGHLKESLKLLDVIYENNDFRTFFCTPYIIKLLDDISIEIKFMNGSLNKKYLDIRHDAFHYDTTDKKNINAFIKANHQLCENGFEQIDIEMKNGYYNSELASDVLTLTKYFNCNEIPKEITILYDKVVKIIKLILTNVCNKN